jgi:diaminopimelate epimerase
MSRLSITKCQACGNDFVLLERRGDEPRQLADLARTLCDRHYGIGADGLLVIEPSRAADADLDLHIFNADGSEAEMCGNGVRCVARYWFERSPDAPKSLSLRTQGGIVRTEIIDAGPRFAVRVAMGVPESVSLWDDPATFCGLPVKVADVLIGNPHCVVFVDVDPASVDLAEIASAIAPQSAAGDDVNVEVARVGDGGVDMRVQERGVGETLACGTGACAVALAAITMGTAVSPVGVSMRGGDVVVAWSGPEDQVYLTGSAEIVFSTAIELPDPVKAAAATGA